MAYLFTPSFIPIIYISPYDVLVAKIQCWIWQKKVVFASSLGVWGNEEKAEIQQAISMKGQLHFKQLLSTYYESVSSKFEEMYKYINNYAISMYYTGMWENGEIP